MCSFIYSNHNLALLAGSLIDLERLHTRPTLERSAPNTLQPRPHTRGCTGHP